MYGNLRSVCENHTSLGVTRFLLARALESRVELDVYRGIVSATNTVVCRLTANIEPTGSCFLWTFPLIGLYRFATNRELTVRAESLRGHCMVTMLTDIRDALKYTRH